MKNTIRYLVATSAFLYLVASPQSVLAQVPLASQVATAEEALRCSEGFTMVRTCEKVRGPHDADFFSLCLRLLENGKSVSEINVVSKKGFLYSRINSRVDSAKNSETLDVDGFRVRKDSYRGEPTRVVKSLLAKSYEYVEYTLVANSHYNRDHSWTHQLFVTDHLVLEDHEDRARGISDTRLDSNSKKTLPNLFNCDRVQ
jgi:hypothetical protein